MFSFGTMAVFENPTWSGAVGNTIPVGTGPEHRVTGAKGIPIEQPVNGRCSSARPVSCGDSRHTSHLGLGGRGQRNEAHNCSSVRIGTMGMWRSDPISGSAEACSRGRFNGNRCRKQCGTVRRRKYSGRQHPSSRSLGCEHRYGSRVHGNGHRRSPSRVFDVVVGVPGLQ